MPDPIAPQEGRARYPASDWMDHERNYKDAVGDLNLNPQEQYLYRHHLENLKAGGLRASGPEGPVSTLRAMTTQIGDRVYTLPTVWDNKQLSPEESVKRAKKVGLDKFPSYSDDYQANQRYHKMHEYIDRDVR